MTKISLSSERKSSIIPVNFRTSTFKILSARNTVWEVIVQNLLIKSINQYFPPSQIHIWAGEKAGPRLFFGDGDPVRSFIFWKLSSYRMTSALNLSEHFCYFLCKLPIAYKTRWRLNFFENLSTFVQRSQYFFASFPNFLQLYCKCSKKTLSLHIISTYLY